MSQALFGFLIKRWAPGRSGFLLPWVWLRFGFNFALSGFLLASFWLPSGLASFWLPSGFLLASFWLLSGFLLASFWLLSGFFLASFWLLSGLLLSGLAQKSEDVPRVFEGVLTCSPKLCWKVGSVLLPFRLKM